MGTRHDFERANRQSNADQIAGVISSFLQIGGVWFFAIFIWSVAFDAWRIPLLIAGAIVGGFLGLTTGLVVGGQSSKLRAREMRFASSMMLFPPALLIFSAGLVTWAIRSII